MSVIEIFRHRLDALLHPSARGDALVSARHRVFIAPRLLGGFAALAAFPAYLALRGAPGVLEVAAFAWPVAPILLAYFLSRTGRFERAHMLSSLALACLVVGICVWTGGMDSFAAIWLLVIPLDVAASSSRRALLTATALALVGVVVLVLLGTADMLPARRDPAQWRAALDFIGIVSAVIYVAGAAFVQQALSRIGTALLSAEEERYRLLARNMSDLISRHGRSGVTLFVSPASQTLLGAPPSALLGHSLFDRVHVADRPAYLTALSEAARGAESRSVEFRIRRDASADERARGVTYEFIWLEMRCRPLIASRAGDEAEVVAVMRDVSERKHQELALAAAREAAERADASRGRFLATMSHELRTPLNAIIGFSDMIAQEGELRIDAERRREYAQLINESGQHLLSVVNSILDMSKMESGNFEILPEPFAPRPALINCCNLLALKARESGIDLVVRAPETLPQIIGDPRAFKQIVLNLVANAIKFTERGGSVAVSAAVEGSHLMLRVADTGVGIAAEDLCRIGDPFFQAGASYGRRHEGTGLGFSIVKTLVALHGGDIRVESRVNEGTTVAVALPVACAMPSDTVTRLASRTNVDTQASDVQVKKRA